MKKGWRLRPLGAVVTIAKARGGSRPLPYVGLEDISSGGTGQFLGSLTPQSDKSTTFEFGPEHLLYGRLRPYLNKALLPDFVGHCSSEIFPLLPSSELDRRFLFYWMTADTQVTQINSTCTGARMPRADMEDVLRLELPLPQLDEQRKIVAILDEAFDGIYRARANVEGNIESAKEVLDSFLVATFKEVEQRAERITLEQASLNFGRGRSRHRPRNAPFLYGGPYPFIQTGDIRNSDGVVKSYTQTYSEEGLKQSKLWPAGTVCITIAANIAETAVLGFDACFPDSVIGMVTDPNKTVPEYVEYMLRYFSKELKAQGKGSAQDNINLGTFENAVFPFPTLEEQKNIIAKLSSVSEHVESLRAAFSAKAQGLEALRQSLLQKAFAGELT